MLYWRVVPAHVPDPALQFLRRNQVWEGQLQLKQRMFSMMVVRLIRPSKSIPDSLPFELCVVWRGCSAAQLGAHTLTGPSH